MRAYAIKRSDGRYMCIFLKGKNKKVAELICERNYKNCKVVEVEIREVEDDN